MTQAPATRALFFVTGSLSRFALPSPRRVIVLHQGRSHGQTCDGHNGIALTKTSFQSFSVRPKGSTARPLGWFLTSRVATFAQERTCHRWFLFWSRLSKIKEAKEKGELSTAEMLMAAVACLESIVMSAIGDSRWILPEGMDPLDLFSQVDEETEAITRSGWLACILGVNNDLEIDHCFRVLQEAVASGNHAAFAQAKCLRPRQATLAEEQQPH